MCVIIHKPEDKILSVDELHDAFVTNSDGAGYMWREEGSVIIRKGFMTIDALIKDLEERGFIYDNNLKEDMEIALHFRIATSGGVCPGRTHPFPINKSFVVQERLVQETQAAVMHNGVISGLGDANFSDTQEVVGTAFYHVFRPDISGRELKEGVEGVTPSVSFYSSKFLVFTPDRTFYLGEFKEVDGIFYSNLNHRTQYRTVSVPQRTVFGDKLPTNAITNVIRQYNDGHLLIPHFKLLPLCFESPNCITCKYFRFRKGTALCIVWRKFKNDAQQSIPVLAEYLRQLKERLNAACVS